MTPDDWRAQGAEACRAFFAEHADDFAELCAAGYGSAVTKALTIRAVTAATAAIGIDCAAGHATFAEGFVEQTIAEIEAKRGRPATTKP